MNAYKCDICGKYFEEARAKTGSTYTYNAEVMGHHKLELALEPSSDNEDWKLFNGDICPDCMGYFCVGLCEIGCQDTNVKMYAADYIRRVREEKEAADGPTE